jgi:4-amino-4-deoxy-L-arabinose transferase-like glycosyltransferase
MPSEKSGSSLLARAGKGLLVVALVLMTAHVLIYAAFGTALIPFPFDYDQAEGFELNNAILLAKGGCPYCDNNVFPFYASGYTPFFHILLVPFVWLFGAQFWYGRLLIFLATFVTAGAIAWAVRRATRHTAIALLAGMAFLASNYIYHIGPLLRQHLLMVMLETLAVVIIAPAFDTPPREKRRRLMIAFTLLLLAGYTKQLAVYTAAAIAIWTFLRNPRTAIVYTFVTALAAGVIFAGWMLATDGQWWVNIITSNLNPYS